MTSYTQNIDAFNHIVTARGGVGGHIFNVDALNEWCVLEGGAGGHQLNIAALNEIDTLKGGPGGHALTIAALNSILTLLGGVSGHTLAVAALNAIAEISVVVTPPADPLPDGETVDDGTFEEPVSAITVNEAIRLKGKKATGSGKFLYDLGAPASGTKYTMTTTQAFNLLSNGGKNAFVGFGVRDASGNYVLIGLKGDGATGLNTTRISGANINSPNGATVTNLNAADHGTQAGPNRHRFETSADNSTYTYSTSSNGTDWTVEATGAMPAGATGFGPAAYFEAGDTGSFSIDVKVWQSVAAVVTPKATLNPDDKAPAITLSGGNLTATKGATTSDAIIRATDGKSSGKHYWEDAYTVVGSGGGISSGLATLALDLAPNFNFIGVNGIFFANDGSMYGSASGASGTTGSYPALARGAGDRLCHAADLDARLYWVRKNDGLWNGSASANPATGVGGIALPTGTLFPALAPYGANAQAAINFGGSAFAHSVPAGFNAGWNRNQTEATFSRWQLFILNNNGDGWNIGISEIEFREAVGVAQTAAGGTAFASSQWDGANGPEKAFNGITTDTDVWISGANQVTNQHIGYNFVAAKTIRQVMLKVYGAYTANMPKGMILQGSNDGAAWTDVKTMTATGWTADEVRLFTVQ